MLILAEVLRGFWIAGSNDVPSRSTVAQMIEGREAAGNVICQIISKLESNNLTPIRKEGNLKYYMAHRK